MRLGLRLSAAGGPRRWWSLGLVAGGIATALLGILLSVAAVRVVDARVERTEARGLVFAARPADAQGWATVRRIPFGDRMLLRVDVDPSSADLPVPPGLTQWPGPGQVSVSPAAGALLTEDVSFADLAPGVVVARVADEGLRSPDELVIYRGVPRADQPRGGEPITSPAHGGSRIRDTMDASPGQMAALAGLLAVLAGFPAVAFLTVAARLSAAMRARRLGALHFLGAAPSMIRRVNAVETTALAVLGWVVAVLVYPAANRLLAGSGLLGSRWFAADTALTVTGACVLLLATLLLAGAIGARADLGTNLTRVTVRHPGDRRAVSRWRLVPLAVGLASLTGQVVVGSARPDGAVPIRLDLLMLSAVGVTGLGLVLAMPALVRVCGTVLATYGRDPAARLGGARASFDPAGAARLVTALALVVMSAGVTIGQTRDARAVSTPMASVVPITVSASEIPSGHGSMLVDAVHGPVLAVVRSDLADRQVTTVLVARCSDLSTVGNSPHPVDDCRDGTVYPFAGAAARGIDAADLRGLVPGADSLPEGGTLPDALAKTWPTPQLDGLVTVDVASVIDASPKGPSIDATGATTYLGNLQLVIPTASELVDSTLGAVIRVAPYSQPSAEGLDPDSGQNIAMINGFIRLGLLLGAALTLAALATGLADRATARRRADTELMLVGADRRTLHRAHLWEVLVTVGFGALTALLCGVLGGLAWQYAGGLVREPDLTSIAGLAIATAFALAATVAAAMAAAPRDLDPELLRRE